MHVEPKDIVIIIMNPPKKLSPFFYYFFGIYVCTCVREGGQSRLWKLEDSLQESGISFYHVGPGNEVELSGLVITLLPTVPSLQPPSFHL